MVSIADEQQKIAKLRSQQQGIIAEREALRNEKEVAAQKLAEAVRRKELAEQRWRNNQEAPGVEDRYKAYKAALDAERRERKAYKQALNKVKRKTRQKKALDEKVDRQTRIARKKTGEAPVRMRANDPDANKATYNPITETYTRKDRVPKRTVTKASVRTPSALSTRTDIPTTTQTLTPGTQLPQVVTPVRAEVTPQPKERFLERQQTKLRRTASKSDPVTAAGLGVLSVGVGLAQFGRDLVTKPVQTGKAVIDVVGSPVKTTKKGIDFVGSTASSARAGQPVGFYNIGKVAGEAALLRGVKVGGRAKPVVEIKTPKGTITAKPKTFTKKPVYEVTRTENTARQFIDTTGDDLTQLNPKVERVSAQGTVVTGEAGEKIAARLELRELRRREAAKTAREGRNPDSIIKNLDDTRKKATEQAMKESDQRVTPKKSKQDRVNEFVKKKEPNKKTRAEKDIDEAAKPAGSGTSQQLVQKTKGKTQSKQKSKAKSKAEAKPAEKAFVELSLKQKPRSSFRLRGASKETTTPGTKTGGLVQPIQKTPTKPVSGSLLDSGTKPGTDSLIKTGSKTSSTLGFASVLSSATKIGTVAGAAAFAAPKLRKFKPLKTKKPLKVDTSGGKKNPFLKSRKRGKQSFKFRPSVTGIFAGIKESKKKKTGFSGLELRGI